VRDYRSGMESPGSRRRLSIVVPMYNEHENVERLGQRMVEVNGVLKDVDVEWVVVDDGSADGCLEAFHRYVDPSVRVVSIAFSRNFGSHAALSAGLQAATGDAVTWMGADLQEPISMMVDLVGRWNAGHDVVWAIRSHRAQRSVGRFLSTTFWKLLHRFSNVKGYPEEGPSIFLCDRTAVDAVNRLTERNRNILLLIAWVGFRSDTISFVQDERQGGESKWNTKKLIKTAVDSLVQFSTAPMRAMTYLGTALASVGFLYALFLIVRSMFETRAPEGWTTVIVAVLILGGLQLLMLGVLGEYLWRGTDESRERPIFVVDPRRTSVTFDGERLSTLAPDRR
jgi:polyisoprenyl-phosphate glycosyltransferase